MFEILQSFERKLKRNKDDYDNLIETNPSLEEVLSYISRLNKELLNNK